MKRRIQSLFPHRTRLVELNSEEAVRIVSQSGGHLTVPELAGRIVAFVGGGKTARPFGSATIEPFLLSVFCRELNERRIAAGTETITREMLEGGQQAILQELLSRAFVGRPASLLETVGECLLTKEGFRIQYPLRGLASRARLPEHAFRDLVELRILRVEERGGADVVELTHDLLAPVVLEQRRRWRRERAARLQRRSAAAILIPVLLWSAVLIHLASTAAARSRAAAAMAGSLQGIYELADPNTANSKKDQDFDSTLANIDQIAESNPDLAAGALADIEGIALRASDSLTSIDQRVFQDLANLHNANPGDSTITLAYASGLLRRGVAESRVDKLLAAERDDQQAIVMLTTLIEAAGPPPAAFLARGQAELELGSCFAHIAESQKGPPGSDAGDLDKAKTTFKNSASDFLAYEREDKADTAEAIANAAWATNKSSDMFRDIGNEAAATAKYEEAHAYFQSLGAKLSDSPDWTQNDGVVEMNLAIFKMDDDDPAAALGFFQGAMNTFLSLHDNVVPDSPEILSTVGWSRDYIAIAYYRLTENGNAASQSNDIKDAQNYADQAVKNRVEVLKLSPNDSQWRDDLTHSNALVAAIAGLRDLNSGQPQTAVQDYSAAITLTNSILNEGKSEFLRLADDYIQRARAETASGSSASARTDLSLARKALASAGYCTAPHQTACQTTNAVDHMLDNITALAFSNAARLSTNAPPRSGG